MDLCEYCFKREHGYMDRFNSKSLPGKGPCARCLSVWPLYRHSKDASPEALEFQPTLSAAQHPTVDTILPTVARQHDQVQKGLEAIVARAQELVGRLRWLTSADGVLVERIGDQRYARTRQFLCDLFPNDPKVSRMTPEEYGNLWTSMWQDPDLREMVRRTAVASLFELYGYRPVGAR